MPQERLPMRKMRDVLRLSANGLSKRKIAVSLGLSATAAGDCIRRAREAGGAWPPAAGVNPAGLERLLFSVCGTGREAAAGARLGDGPSRTQARGRNAAAAVGRVSRRAPRWPRLQSLLSEVSRVEAPAVTDNAADACGG